MSVWQDRPRAIKNPIGDDKLFARGLPFRLAFKLQDGEIAAEDAADIVQACVVTESGEPVFASVDDVLEADWQNILVLFQEVSKGIGSVTTKAARKNSKASRR